MDTILQSKCDQLIEIFGLLREENHFAHDALLVVGACMYLFGNTPVDAERLKECRLLLKQKKSVFSKHRGITEFVLRCRMALSDDPEAYLDRLDAVYRELKSLRRREQALLASMVIAEQAGLEERDEVIRRTKALFRAMRKTRFLLTSMDDLPLAAMLAAAGKDADVCAEAEEVYGLLRSKRTLSRKSCHMLSYLLTVCPGDTKEECEKICRITAGLRETKHTLFGRCSAILATLADAPLPAEELVSRIGEADDYFIPSKPFVGILGIDGSLRKMTAVQMVEAVLNDCGSSGLDGAEAVSSVISTSIEVTIVACVARGCKRLLRKIFFRRNKGLIGAFIR